MNSTIDTDRILRAALDAAAAAGKVIKHIRLGDSLAINFKDSGVRNLVTVADLEAEKAILTRIKEEFPDHAILSEESNPNVTDNAALDGPLWIIDPVDGTTNYAYGHYQVGISIAFSYRGTVLVGVVASPFTEEIFHAVKGQGAFLNNKPIRANAPESLEKSLIGTGFPFDRDELAPIVRRIDLVLQHCRDIRRVGAASLDVCWVACGRLDAFYETINAWDIAAGCLIAREAGARTGNLAPSHLGLPEDLNANELVVAAKTIMDDLCALLRKID